VSRAPTHTKRTPSRVSTREIRQKAADLAKFEQRGTENAQHQIILANDQVESLAESTIGVQILTTIYGFYLNFIFQIIKKTIANSF
jgi:hypothetical protein